MTEKKYLADTSFLIDLEEERPEALKKIQENNISTGALCIYELQKTKPNEKIGNIGKRWIQEFTAQDADKAAEIHRKTLKHGKTIKPIDCLIAAQAINRNMTLLTADTDFQKIESLQTEYYRETQ